MKNSKIELLAPAGNIDSFKAACQNGADAIYMGVTNYNARAMAQNFDINSYIEAIKYAHLRGIKVYLTLNTLMNEEEFEDALNIVKELYEYNLDAVIIQDIGLFMLLHELFPNLKIHASTQMSVYSLEQVKFLEKLGFSRVVLARELSVDEIEYICKNTSVEIEVFIHGALCVSVSGQCNLSSVIGNRSANKGSCAQPCRMKYTLNRVNKKENIVSSTYLLSKKDIFGIDYIEKLKNAGVTSIKVEGRNKFPEYVARVVNIYRKYIDKIYEKEKFSVSDNDKQELLQLFNRNGKSYGYLDGVKYKDSITTMSPKNTGIFLGTVISQKKEYIKVKLQEDISLHDGIEIYDNNENVFSNVVTCIKDENFNTKNYDMKKGEYVYLGDVNKKIKYGSAVYRTSSKKLLDKYKKTYTLNSNNKKLFFDIEVFVNIDKNLKAIINNKEIILDYIVQVAKSKQITKENVKEAFLKTLDTPFMFKNINVNIDENAFVPISKLNELRRMVVSYLEKIHITKNDISCINIENCIKKYNKQYEEYKSKLDRKQEKNLLFVYNFDTKKDYFKIYESMYNKNLDIIEVTLNDYIKHEEYINKTFKNIKVYINISNFVLDQVDKILKDNISRYVKNVNGFVIGSTRYLNLLQSYKSKWKFDIIADYSLNIINIYSAMFYLKMDIDFITVGFDINDLNLKRIRDISNILLPLDFVCCMTSRYCILGSFVANRKSAKEKCSMPCLTKDYYIKDKYDKRYYIVCDNIDCVSKLISRTKKFDNKKSNIYGHTII